VKKAGDGIRIEVAEAIAIYYREPELLEVHQHVENLAICQAALPFHEIQ
jgi:hypothetical protein